MEEWKEYTIEDVLELLIDYRGKTPKKSETGIPTLSAKSVKMNHIDYSQCYYISKEEYDRFMIRGFPKKGDILLTTEAPLGMVARLDRNDIALGQRLITLRGKKDVLDNGYLLYYFQSPAGQYNLKSRETGTTVTGIKQSEFRKLRIPIPPLSTQQKIAAILSSLDDKIELNNKINTNLEQQAQALFKNWFVDFEPFGGKMPEGWKVGKLSDMAEITMGQSPDGKSYNEDGIGTVFYQGRAEFGTRFPTRRLFTTEPKRIAKKFDTLMSVRAPVGDLNIANEDCCIGRGLAAIHSKDNHQSFVHYTVVSLRPQLDVFNGEGTVFGCINRDALNNMEVIIPSKNDLDKFEEIISTFDTEIFNRSEENDRLKNIRDTLLPKLMNGEIEVNTLKL
ncbi:restriction endonuclease subunit S [Treponema sp.]|uniref:restriction endonuclease subunit S n=1 Tax=Treponema sp. TaxID=166 RepID=UPI0038905A9B